MHAVGGDGAEHLLMRLHLTWRGCLAEVRGRGRGRARVRVRAVGLGCLAEVRSRVRVGARVRARARVS